MAHEADKVEKDLLLFCAHFWQISKSSVLDREVKKTAVFQTAGKTPASKTPYCQVKSQAALYKKVGYDFLEKVAVGSKRQSGSFLEQDSTG